MREAGASEWKEGAEGRGKRPKGGQTPTLTSSSTLRKFSIRYSGGTLFTGQLGTMGGAPQAGRDPSLLAPKDINN